MKKGIILLAGLFLVAAVHPGFAAGDPVAGKAKAGACAACHGAQGISANPLWPNLAGQQEQYLAKQLKDFKSGSRKDPLMTSQAAGLPEDDIANLAAYFGSLSCR